MLLRGGLFRHRQIDDRTGVERGDDHALLGNLGLMQGPQLGVLRRITKPIPSATNQIGVKNSADRVSTCVVSAQKMKPKRPGPRRA